MDIVDVVDERLRMGDMMAANVVDANGCVSWTLRIGDMTAAYKGRHFLKDTSFAFEGHVICV